MAKKYFILKHTYTSMDWHDWKEYWCFLGKEKNKYEINPDGFINIVLNDIAKDNSFSRNIANNIRKALSKGITYRKFFYEDGGDMSIYINGDTITSQMEYYWTCIDTYTLIEIEAENIVYLPVEQFICWPKRSPGCERIYTEYSESLTEAKADLKKIESTKEEIYPYHSSKKSILITDKNKITEDTWYQDQIKIIKDTPNPKKDNSWHPSLTVQLKNLYGEEYLNEEWSGVMATSQQEYEIREYTAKLLMNFFDYYNGTMSGGADAPRIIKDIKYDHNPDVSRVEISYTYPYLSNVGVSTYHNKDAGKIYNETMNINSNYEKTVDDYYKKLNPDNSWSDLFIPEINQIKNKIKEYKLHGII